LREELSVPLVLYAEPQGHICGKAAGIQEGAHLWAGEMNPMLMDIDADVTEPHVINGPQLRFIGGVGKAPKHVSGILHVVIDTTACRFN